MCTDQDRVREWDRAHRQRVGGFESAAEGAVCTDCGGVGGEYSGKEAVCKMGGCACDPNVYVDWGMRVCTGFGEIGEQMCRFGGVCSGEGPVCRSGACA